MTAEGIKRRAQQLGFDLCGIASADAFPELGRLAEWLEAGYAGEMAYLHRSADIRADIRRFLPSARSVIITATVHDASDATPHEDVGDAVRIARYARGVDYHHVLASRLTALLTWLHEASSSPFEAAIFADNHPVQERAHAARAGLGWIGKNTCLINPKLGSWLLLGGVACSLDLAPDVPEADHCGSCLAPLATTDPAWAPVAGRDRAGAAELFERADDELHAFVEGSAMTYTTLARLRRNLAVVIANSGDPARAEALDRPGRGVRNAAPSAATPLVREHVAWAKARLGAVGRGL